MSSEATYGDPATRRRILEAAWEVIQERGSAMRLAEVSDRARVSRQALYLHFGDRSGLLVALVEFMDDVLGLEDLVARVFAASSGTEMLQRTMDLYVVMAPRIDRVAQVLEAAASEDEGLAAAWRNRMDNRQRIHRMIVERIAAEGQLADVWTIDVAADLFYAITLPGPWRELTKESGWTPEDYGRLVGEFLRRALIDDVPPKDR